MVHTRSQVMANRPGEIIINKKYKSYILIDVVTPADRNIVRKVSENELKYRSLCGEIHSV